MTALLELPALEPGSDAWHAQRRRALGGSEIAAALDLSPYTSAFALWHQKAGLVPAGTSETERMAWGTVLEEPVRAMYARRTGADVGKPNATFQRADRPWQLYSPDGLVHIKNDTLLLECKCVDGADRPAWGDPGTDDIPMHYRVQVMWGMDTLGLQEANVAALFGGNTMHVYVVHYDEADAQLLRTAGKAFIDSIDAGDRPDIDGSPATYAALRALNPGIERRDVQLDEREMSAYVFARQRYVAAEAEMLRQQGRLLDRMGTARRARFDGKTIATRQAKEDGVPYLVAGRTLPYVKEQA